MTEPTEKIIIKCKKDTCKYKKSESNDYCLKHQADFFKESALNADKKLCKNYIST